MIKNLKASEDDGKKGMITMREVSVAVNVMFRIVLAEWPLYC